MPREPGVVYEFGPSFRLDTEDGSLTCDGRPVNLPPKAADVLLVLLEAEGGLVAREQFRERIWSEWSDNTFDFNKLHFQLHQIRKALRPGLNGQECIQSISGKGFRFVLPVRPVSPAIIDQPRASEPTSVAAAVRPPAARRWWPLAVVVPLGTAVVMVGFMVLVREPPAAPRVAQITALTDVRGALTDSPLLTDGSRVYFGAATTAASYTVPVTGGEVSTILHATSAFRMLDVSPRRAELLAVRADPQHTDDELWVLPAASGAPRRVGDIRCSFAVWSPDAQHIAYVRDNDLYIADHEGTTLRKLDTPKPGSPWWPRWSPDGDVLRFTLMTPVDRSAPKRSLWEVRADGTGLRRLLTETHAAAEACCGNWSPDGATYVFQATEEGRTDLWALTDQRDRAPGGKSASSAPVRLTAGPLSFTGPVFSRDGRTLFAVGTLNLGEVVRYSAAQRELVPYLRGVSGTWLTFSPDQQWVAYVSYPDRKLWKQRVDGGGKQQLTTGPFDLDGSMWSPDGKWIAFRSRMSGQSMKIYLLPSDGGEARPISSDDQEQGIPSWSPDSTQLVFGDVPARFGQPKGDEVLHVYDVVRRELSIVPGSQGQKLWTTRWSPDGRYLAALTIEGQALRLYDFQTREWRSYKADHVDNPTWSRDGRYVHYITEGGARVLRRLRVSDGLVEDLADLRDYPMGAYWWSGLAPDDSPIILRNLAAPEVYALQFEPR